MWAPLAALLLVMCCCLLGCSSEATGSTALRYDRLNRWSTTAPSGPPGLHRQR